MTFVRQTPEQTKAKHIARATDILTGLAEEFGKKSFPDTVRDAFIIAPDKPCSKWGMTNKIIMLLSKTHDARGYRQWQNVGRHVKKGSKAFYIVKVRTIKIKDKDKTGKETEKTIPAGIITIPVFRYEDTEGKPLATYEPKSPLPLIEVAKKWDMKVVYENTTHGEHGSFTQSTNTISLCTENPAVFFHELAHKAHSKIEKLKGGQDPRQEAIAELTACVLASVYGYDSVSQSWNYIAHYSNEKTPVAVGRMCMGVLTMVQKILQIILSEADSVQPTAAKPIPA